MAKYLPTKDFHVLKITGLSPEDLKLSYKECEKDKKDFKLNSALNFIIKNFGIKGNISTYTEWYKHKLLPFMKKNDLLDYRDLTCSKNGLRSLPSFTHQQIAERLYFSNKRIPYKIYTGHRSKIKYKHGMDDFTSNYDFPYHNEIVDLNSTPNLIDDSYVENFNNDADIYLHLQYSPGIGYVDNDNFTNVICTPHNIPFRGNSMYPNLCTFFKAKNIKSYSDYSRWLKEEILMKRFKDNWVEVIKFENIYFLKGLNGEYDFVFENLRDKAFDTKQSSFSISLKHGDIPSSFQGDYHFKRWLYFGHNSKNKKLNTIKLNNFWIERDEHLSEDYFYKNNAKDNAYPGRNIILKDYYMSNGKYSYGSKKNLKSIDGFKKVIELNNTELHISELITIEQFHEFLDDEKNKNYLKNRDENLDSLESINAEEDKTLPVTVTWYDTLAYCKWMEDKYDVSVRLLKREEYMKVIPIEEISESESPQPFSTIQFRGYGVSAPYMNQKEFDDLIFEFTRKPKYVVSKDKLSFCIDSKFEEWMFDYNGNALSINTFNANYGHFASGVPDRLATSSGKYKYVKVGFRICYEKTIFNEEIKV